MTEKAANQNGRFVALLLWLLLAYFYTSLSYDYILASNKDKQLEDHLQYVVVLCGDDHRPTREIRSLIVAKADQLKIPLRGDQVGISGSGQSLKIGVSYDVDINLPIFNRTIYRKVFQHQAVYRNIR